MKLEVLISTLNEGINNIENILHERKKNIHYLINHQVWNFQEEKEINARLKKRDDVTFFVTYEKGLSKSRNQAIKNACSEICLIADDDIELVECAEKKILDAFRDNPDADIITFQIQESLERRSKNYEEQPFWYDFKKLSSVSSIEIAVKRSSIKNADLYFDESFGLGTKYPIGEEYIFLTDAYKKGLKILYWPEVIVSHPHPSSGGRLDNNVICARGAVFARVFGLKALFVNLYFSVKKYKIYHKKYSFYQYFKLMNKGTVSFLKKQFHLDTKG